MTINERKPKEKKPEKVKPKKLASKCLLLKTPDQRCFFTEEKNFPVLVEFGRTFDAEISVVKMKDQIEILELDDLAKNICSETLADYPPYEVVEIKLASPTKKMTETREAKLIKATEIIDFIRAEMLAGKTVIFSELEAKFSTIAKSSLANHFARTRRELSSQGHLLKRDKPGQWRLANELKKDPYDGPFKVQGIL